MKKFTLYIDDMPVYNFENIWSAEDCMKSLANNSKNMILWDNETDKPYDFFDGSEIFNETKDCGDVIKTLVIQRYENKVKSKFTETNKKTNEQNIRVMNFTLCSTFPTYSDNIKRSKKYFKFS